MPPVNQNHHSSPSISPSPSFIEHHLGDDDYDDDRFETPSPEFVAYERRKRRNRILLLLLSLVVLVGIITVIFKSGVLASNLSPDDYDAGMPVDAANNGIVYFQAKVQALCTLTDFKDACVTTLFGYADSSKSADPKTLVLVSIQAAINAVERAINYSAGVNRKLLEPRTGVGFGDCEELLAYASVELRASGVRIKGMDVDELLPRTVAGMRDALSAAVAFEETCTDGLVGSAEKPAVEMLVILKNVTENTRNNLAIISGMTSHLEGVYELSSSPSSQRVGQRKIAEKRGGERENVWWSGAGVDDTTPDVVVAKDGSGDFKAISEALKRLNSTTTTSRRRRRQDGRFVIYVKEGVYDEIVRVTAEMKNLTVYGDGPGRTVVTGNRSFADGYSLFRTATFAVSGFGFVARNMGFRNAAGPESGQGAALRVESDLAVFYNCYVDGYHNVLHAHAHRQFYRECVIAGATDIISGDAAAVFQNCEILLKKPTSKGQPNVVTAQSRVDRHESTGIIVQNCSISAATGEAGPLLAFLGRPTKERSRTVVMQSVLGDVIKPEGWAPATDVGDLGGALVEAEAMGNSLVEKDKKMGSVLAEADMMGGPLAGAEKTVYFAEFENRGPGAEVSGRVTWPGYHLLRDAAEVARFTTREFLQGLWWLNATGVPFFTGVL